VRVIQILPESAQALVAEREERGGRGAAAGPYRLVGVGDTFAGYTVAAIDDDEVVLAAAGREIILAAPAAPGPLRAAEPLAGGSRDAHAAPVDPYDAVLPGAPQAPAAPPDGDARAAARAPALPDAPIDPYADPAVAPPSPVREIRAPSGARPLGDEPVRVASAGGASRATPGDAAIGVAAASAGAPQPTAAMASPPPASAPGAGQVSVDGQITRRELDAALADFGALAQGFRATLTPEGARVTHVAAGAVFAKAGLRAGDLITSVDGRPLRSLDDVALLYARAPGLRSVAAQVTRGGAPIVIRVAIQ
jgi:hypothetical protein